ncbi:MAG: hypothetical protein E7029_01005 [Planctomycetaceae bacterium]|nr:hypothetical protein [Planctomycetaceae bacterium]
MQGAKWFPFGNGKILGKNWKFRPMFDQLQLHGIVEQDPRYHLNAYYYVLETLEFARSQLGMGCSSEYLPPRQKPGEDEKDEPDSNLHHITGNELCEAIRIRARWMFGYMAKTVFNQWGVHTTDDFGEIVFNMVNAGKIRTAPGDRKEDFSGIYDFQAVFCDDYVFPTEAVR